MLKVKDVISLKIRFNNNGEKSKTTHPYIVKSIDEQLGIIEVIQRDSVKEGKEYIALFNSNALLRAGGCFDKDGFVQLDNKFTIQNFNELSNFKIGSITDNQFLKITMKYDKYQKENTLDENKIVHMTKEEILKLNKM